MRTSLVIRVLASSVVLVLAVFSGACGGEDAAPVAAPKVVATPPKPAAPPIQRSEDPRFVAAADAWDLGHLDEADRKLLALGDAAGIDGDLLRARIAASRGDDVGAVRIIEGVRAAHPDDERVFATAAEIHAGAGRFQSAEDEIRGGLLVHPTSPDIERARGVLMISRKGGAASGLEHLLAAQKLEPKLPYCRHALAQAHLLLANFAMSKLDAKAALEHASASLVEEPDDLDAKNTLADAQASLKNFDVALKLYEELKAAGRDVGGTLAMLYKTAAFAALLEKNRPLAIERYVRARELGLSTADLNSGANLLHDECEVHTAAGLKAYDAQDLAGAETELRAALRMDPTSLEARNYLGVVLYGRGDFTGAADCWRIVVETARAKKIKLSEPVHLDLARALYRLERFDELRTMLESALAETPDADWAPEAREMLKRIAGR